MKRIILLNNTNYPDEFKNINIIPPIGISKEIYVENAIIKAMNQYNSKLNISSIEYAKIEEQFESYKKGTHNGVLIEEEVISIEQKTNYQRKGYYVYSDAGVEKARKILMYLFISNTGEIGRNGFVSQTIFPTLLEYVEDVLPTATYGLSNHEFCFINISNKIFTSNMILRHLASLHTMGMHYVEVFTNSLNVDRIPKDLKKFLVNYSTDYLECYSETTDIYENSNYKIEFANKKFFIKTDDMISKLIKSGENIDFNGSGEKFYWIEILPMSMFAYKCGFKVDYSAYEMFVDVYKSKFSARSEKMVRCQILLLYFQKYFG